MKQKWVWFLALGGAYLLTGFTVIRGNEQGVLRRFGRVQTSLLGPGLHYSLPWPFSRVNKVNRNEIRSVTVGVSLGEEATLTSFDAATARYRQGEFLTGDKNVLLLAGQVQYRVSDPINYLFSTESTERLLANLVEREVTSIVSRSGVDYVHPLGLNELRGNLSHRVQAEATSRQLGLEIEDVVLTDVRPPSLVKQAFLDVSNARAERSRLVSEAQTNAERLQVQSEAQSRKIQDEAAVERQTRIAIAHGESERFLKLIEQISAPESGADDATVRRGRMDTFQRLYLQAMGEILPRLKGRIFTEGDRPIDLSIWNEQESGLQGE